MTRLSVNLNKVALLRNSRSLGIPSVIRAAMWSIEAGARGITVHPRPDQRHIREADVRDLATLLQGFPEIELNIEGNPFPEYLDLVREVRPRQATLVPDSPGATTSDHGWDLEADGERLEPVIAELRALGVRVSLFVDHDRVDFRRARELGADRVELYTEPFARAFATGEYGAVLAGFSGAARRAQAEGLGVNAGHDLNLANLATFTRVPGILEVSIGHALVADALELGFRAAVTSYLAILEGP